MYRSPRGILLVEAILSAVVITVGLVFVSRALGGQLSAIRRAEETVTMLRLARDQLILLETQAQERGFAEAALEGAFDDPYATYAWQVVFEPLDAPSPDEPAMTRVTMTVYPALRGGVRLDEDAGPSLRLTAFWPSEWAARGAS